VLRRKDTHTVCHTTCRLNVVVVDSLPGTVVQGTRDEVSQRLAGSLDEGMVELKESPSIEVQNSYLTDR